MTMFRKIYRLSEKSLVLDVPDLTGFKVWHLGCNSHAVVETICGILNSKGKIETVALEHLFVTNTIRITVAVFL